MIGNKQKKEEPNTSGLHNTLATSTTIVGNIITETDFRLDGKVEGDIKSNAKIVIGPKGSVNGNIIADNAEIHGQVTGTLKIGTKLILKSTATVKGEITTQTIEIEPNAVFNGTCTMSDNTAIESNNKSVKQK